MIRKVFSPQLLDLIQNPDTTGIDNINPHLGELLVAGIYSLEKGHLIWVLGENENFREREEKLKKWLRFLKVEDYRINFYTTPFEDPYINNRDDFNAAQYKVKLVSDLLDKQRMIVLTTRSALGIRIEGRGELRDSFLKIKVDKEMPRDELTGRLIEMGYRARGIVEENGDVAWRGSIVDVYPVGSQHPVRIEIEDELVVSIRIFNPNTQKSVNRIQEILLPTVRYFLDYPTNRHYFQDILRKGMPFLTGLLENYRVISADRRKIDEEFDKLMSHYQSVLKTTLEEEQKHELVKTPVEDIFNFPFDRENVLSINDTFDSISGHVEWFKLRHSILELNQEDIGTIKDQIETGGYRLSIHSKRKKIVQNLEEYFEHFDYSDIEIPFSFENPHTGCIFLTRKDFRFQERIEIVEKDHELRSDNLVKEIQVGDWVVHQAHGIGRFVGFKTLGFEDNVTEFLKLEYLKNEFLYVPVYELDVLSKYVAFEGITPQLDKMGGGSWRTKQKRAEKSIVTFARELLVLYATRKAIDGYTYPRDHELEERFDQEFQFVETEDQKRAIRDVLNDLEAEYPMDRLICGDVSFGKTEVALRAAFRVIANGKQAAVLCPTTILAYQHYATFKKRFEHFPITVAMLSRMVTPAKRKKIIKELIEGRIDVVVGTHSLISKDVDFKRLGLYIIDEEQRFGVFQKEKLKKNREDIDCLSLSATPIPRTLSLSMAGLQDISTIQTPPIGRMAIKNYVGWFSREIIMSAVMREVERGGLVFIVYNNIDKIFSFQDQLKAWLPGVSSTVIHAQMKSETIEKNLMDFINKEYRVLISTTIIENGIDIPEVNTLIILGAHRFGLTQLYQLRGRIGRGNRQAYAYFLVQPGNLTGKARTRLEAIREFTELGSGYKIAEFDLKLRGAGSLLGNKQHGHIEALGFDYYHKLLNKTVLELKGELKKEKETPIKINFSYSIEPGYIPNSTERITVYRRILEAVDFDRLKELKSELEDRYGRLPENMETIFYTGMMRVLAKKCELEEMEVYLDKVMIRFPSDDQRRSLVKREFLQQFQKFNIEILDKKSCILHFDDYHRFINEFTGICDNI